MSKRTKTTLPPFYMVGKKIENQRNKYYLDSIEALEVINSLTKNEFMILQTLLKINEVQTSQSISNLKFTPHCFCNVIDLKNLPDGIEEPNLTFKRLIGKHIKRLTELKVLKQVKNKKPIYMINPFLIIPNSTYISDSIVFWDFINESKRQRQTYGEPNE